jgi:hypothetical protein
VVNGRVISNKGERMTYLIGRWYVKMFDGTLEPCQNYGTARYLVDSGYAESVVDPTAELMKA